MQPKQKRMTFSCSCQENSFFRAGATSRLISDHSSERGRKKEVILPLNFIIINDELFLENFDSVQLCCRFLLRQHDFTEVSFS